MLRRRQTADDEHEPPRTPLTVHLLNGHVIGLKERAGLASELLDKRWKIRGRQLFGADFKEEIRGGFRCS